jgi:thioredoxin reductase
MPNSNLTELPVIVIGAGPVGLAAAAHLVERNMQPLVLEAGDTAGAAIKQWGHIRLFSPWRYNIDAASRRILERRSWSEPNLKVLPTGAEVVSEYLQPLASSGELAPHIRYGQRVIAVTRQGLDKTHSINRTDVPFLVRTVDARGETTDYVARAVIDASGTWGRNNPLGMSGLPAQGEVDAAPSLVGPLPDVLDIDRERFAGKHTLVVGAGHSATNTLLNLDKLADAAQGTRITWLVRGASVTRTYGGGDADGLPARGQLGSNLRAAVEAGRITLIRQAVITALETNAVGTTVTYKTPDGEQQITVDNIAGATGFRPDLKMLRELRLDLDPGVEAPRDLAPLIDPEFHSCGTVPPHGADVLAHPEPGFFIVGMKSYGRAPTFLLATGYEQVRSVVAKLAGDEQAAASVELDLPETGVCSTPLLSVDDDGNVEIDESANAGCCATPVPQPVALGRGFTTGSMHGRSGELTTIQEGQS